MCSLWFSLEGGGANVSLLSLNLSQLCVESVSLKGLLFALFFHSGYPNLPLGSTSWQKRCKDLSTVLENNFCNASFFFSPSVSIFLAGAKAFVCDHCGTQFSKEDALESHRQTHTGRFSFTRFGVGKRNCTHASILLLIWATAVYPRTPGRTCYCSSSSPFQTLCEVIEQKSSRAWWWRWLWWVFLSCV